MNGMLATFWSTAALGGWRPQFATSRTPTPEETYAEHHRKDGHVWTITRTPSRTFSPERSPTPTTPPARRCTTWKTPSMSRHGIGGRGRRAGYEVRPARCLPVLGTERRITRAKRLHASKKTSVQAHAQVHACIGRKRARVTAAHAGPKICPPPHPQRWLDATDFGCTVDDDCLLGAPDGVRSAPCPVPPSFGGGTSDHAREKERLHASNNTSAQAHAQERMPQNSRCQSQFQEVCGRFGTGADDFLPLLARHSVESTPVMFQPAVRAAWVFQWFGVLAVAASARTLASHAWRGPRKSCMSCWQMCGVSCLSPSGAVTAAPRFVRGVAQAENPKSSHIPEFRAQVPSPTSSTQHFGCDAVGCPSPAPANHEPWLPDVVARGRQKKEQEVNNNVSRAACESCWSFAEF